MEQEFKPARWLPHALKNLPDREIRREEADKTLTAPERIGEGRRAGKCSCAGISMNA
ncbi:MAG TPA: hypothetical protein VGV68_02860 [Terriglobia bacterium]|nr:hypothetical protein [Terriglobia bacterium]